MNGIKQVCGEVVTTEGFSLNHDQSLPAYFFCAKRKKKKKKKKKKKNTVPERGRKQRKNSTSLNPYHITKTYLYNFDPLKPHFYIVKLEFTGVYIIFLFLLKSKDCGTR